MRHLSIAAVGTLIALLLSACSDDRDATTSDTPPASPARNVILFIPDGSQLAHEIVASRYLHGSDDGLAVHDWPYRGFATTWDVDTYNTHAVAAAAPAFTAAGFDPRLGYDSSVTGTAPYPLQQPDAAAERYAIAAATDSAAAGTALATGHKVDRGNIAWRAGDAADGALPTIAELARQQQGMAMGVVSTVPFSHATPAAFVSHNVNRGDYSGIAHEIITAVRPEVVIGAGHPDPDHDGQAAYTYCAAADYASLADGSAGYRFAGADGADGAGARLLAAADEAVANGQPLFGLFGTAHAVDQAGAAFGHPVPVHSPGAPAFSTDGKNPSLADAAEAAIRVLAQDPDGFFLMVEGGDIDWANHGDQTAWMIGAWQQMEAAVRRTQALVESGTHQHLRPDNTLMIVISDHGNGLLRLRPGYDLPAGALPSAGQYAIGSSDHYAMDGSGTPVPDPDLRYPNGAGFEPTDQRTWFRGHTNELVTCYAWGAGLEHLRDYEDLWYGAESPILDHTHLFHAMAGFLGLDPGHEPMRPDAGG